MLTGVLVEDQRRFVLVVFVFFASTHTGNDGDAGTESQDHITNRDDGRQWQFLRHWNRVAEEEQMRFAIAETAVGEDVILGVVLWLVMQHLLLHTGDTQRRLGDR